MARQQRNKTRAHSLAARSVATSNQHMDPHQADALGAAAVAATFGEDAVLPVGTEADEEPTDTQSLSRGQRKRLKRRAAFVRKMGLVSRVVQAKEKQAKTAEAGVFASLNELASSLVQDEGKTRTMVGQKKKSVSGRQRQKLAVRELSQLKAVQTHASFMSDPFGAIQAHLEHTIVQANQELLQKTTSKKMNGNKMDIEA